MASSPPAQAEWTDLMGGGGGLLKQTVQPGNGKKPDYKSTVSLSWTGKLSDGTVFEEIETTFNIGDGDVIPGIELCARYMQEGEKAVLQCADRFAYGSLGRPGHASQPKFKSTSTSTSASASASTSTSASASASASASNADTTGDALDGGGANEKGFCEVSVVTDGTPVPCSESLRYEIEMVKVGPVCKGFGDMTLAERLVAARAKKEWGNHLFRHKQYVKACKLYKETIEIVEGYDEKAEAMEKQRKQQQMVADYERKKNGTYVTDATSPTSNNGAHTTGAAKTGRTTTATDQAVYDALFRLQIDTGNNLSAALYQRGEWRKAQDTCATVLTLAPNNVKALHKTGRICMQLNDWLEARIALEKALAILSPYSSSTSLASSASSASVVPMDVPEEHKGCGAEAEREKREREEGQKKYAQIKKDLVLLLHRKKQYLASQKQQYGNMFKGKKGREQGNGGQPQRKNPVKAPAGKRPGRSDPEDDSIFHDNVKSSSGHGVSTDSKSTSNETKDTCTGRVQEESEVKANTNISSPPTPKHAAGEPEKTSPSSSPDLPASPFITQLTYQLIPAILLLVWAFYMKR